jgi:hypothetical protein
MTLHHILGHLPDSYAQLVLDIAAKRSQEKAAPCPPTAAEKNPAAEPPAAQRRLDDTAA